MRARSLLRDGSAGRRMLTRSPGTLPRAAPHPNLLTCTCSAVAAPPVATRVHHVGEGGGGRGLCLPTLPAAARWVGGEGTVSLPRAARTSSHIPAAAAAPLLPHTSTRVHSPTRSAPSAHTHQRTARRGLHVPAPPHQLDGATGEGGAGGRTGSSLPPPLLPRPSTASRVLHRVRTRTGVVRFGGVARGPRVGADALVCRGAGTWSASMYGLRSFGSRQLPCAAAHRALYSTCTLAS